jgi:hypothetical protein
MVPFEERIVVMGQASVARASCWVLLGATVSVATGCSGHDDLVTSPAPGIGGASAVALDGDSGRGGESAEAGTAGEAHVATQHGTGGARASELGKGLCLANVGSEVRGDIWSCPEQRPAEGAECAALGAYVECAGLFWLCSEDGAWRRTQGVPNEAPYYLGDPVSPCPSKPPDPETNCGDQSLACVYPRDPADPYGQDVPSEPNAEEEWVTFCGIDSLWTREHLPCRRVECSVSGATTVSVTTPCEKRTTDSCADVAGPTAQSKVDSIVNSIAEETRDYAQLTVAVWFENGCALNFEAAYLYGASDEDVARLPEVQAIVEARLERVRFECAVGLVCGMATADDGYAL